MRIILALAFVFATSNALACGDKQTSTGEKSGRTVASSEKTATTKSHTHEGHTCDHASCEHGKDGKTCNHDGGKECSCTECKHHTTNKGKTTS